MEVKVENWDFEGSSGENSPLMVNFKKVLSDCTQRVHSEAHGNQYDVTSRLTALMDIKEK